MRPIVDKICQDKIDNQAVLNRIVQEAIDDAVQKIILRSKENQSVPKNADFDDFEEVQLQPSEGSISFSKKKNIFGGKKENKKDKEFIVDFNELKKSIHGDEADD